MDAVPTNAEIAAAMPEAPAAAKKSGRSRAPFAPLVSRRLGRGYSRFVGAMKVLLPAGAAILIALVAIWPYLKTTDNRLRLGFSTLVSTEADGPNIINPHLVGFDSGNPPFSITADLAKNIRVRKDFWQEGSPVELEMPKADITLDDGTWLVLTANSGLLTPSDKTLDLSGAVNLFHDSGYELSTSKARVDLEAGAASSDQPVQGQGPFGNLTSEGMQLDRKGGRIVFTGKAKLILYPGAGEAVP
ncbi:MAG: LPS export ABC transporter periplasmic protein LptC [Rhodospirillales bacterium]|nr:LPS export ABC transporter periplasmic protein LptC [Rhodospirillales bacterium]